MAASRLTLFFARGRLLQITVSGPPSATEPGGGAGELRTINKWVHIENMYPLLTLRLLFVHHLRLSDVAVSLKKSQTATLSARARVARLTPLRLTPLPAEH